MYEEEHIIEEVEIETEGDAREYVAEHTDRALYAPVMPGLMEIWFFQAGDHLAVVTNEFGEVALAEPGGDEKELDTTLLAIDLSDGPLTEEGIAEVADTLSDYNA